VHKKAVCLFFATVKWDLGKVAAALIQRDYSAHRGRSRLPQTPQPLQTRRCRGREPSSITRSPPEFFSQACVDKSSCSPFHAVPGSSLSPSTREKRRTPHVPNAEHLPSS